MKYIPWFLGSLLLGFIIMLGYTNRVYRSNKQPVNLPIAKKSDFSLENAPRRSLTGTVLSFSGDTGWQSRIASSPAQLTKLHAIHQGENLQTGNDGHAIIQFNSVCNIEMLPGSNLAFVQTLPDDLVINQVLGSAVYKKLGSIPITIRDLDLLITLNSGEVSISSDTTGQIITVSVRQGSAVAAYNDTQNVSNIIDIPAGRQFVFDDETKQGETQTL